MLGSPDPKHKPKVERLIMCLPSMLSGFLQQYHRIPQYFLLTRVEQHSRPSTKQFYPRQMKKNKRYTNISTPDAYASMRDDSGRTPLFERAIRERLAGTSGMTVKHSISLSPAIKKTKSLLPLPPVPVTLSAQSKRITQNTDRFWTLVRGPLLFSRSLLRGRGLPRYTHDSHMSQQN